MDDPCILNRAHLELDVKTSHTLCRDDLVHDVELCPQLASTDVCLSARDELVKSIVDEHVLGLRGAIERGRSRKERTHEITKVHFRVISSTSHALPL